MLLAVVLVVSALMIRLSNAPVEAGLQYLTFFPAITLSAVAGGFKPGLLATLMGAFFVTYFFTPPFYSISMIALQHSYWGNLVFLMNGLIVSIAIETMHRYRTQLAQDLKKSEDINNALEENTQRLKKSEAQLKAFVSQAPIAIAMFDQNMVYLETSERWIEEYGQDFASLNGRHHYEVHPDLPESWKQVHQRCLNGAMLKNDEDLWIQADGTHKWVRWAVMPWLDEKGAISGIIISGENITERKRNERLLMKSQRENAFLADLIRTCEQPMAVGYPDGQLELTNTAFEVLTGYAAAELQGINWATVLTPPEWLEMEREKLSELSYNDQSVRYEKEFIKKDGTRVPVEVLAHLKTDYEGKPEFYYGFITDITQRKRSEQALKDAARRKDEFLAMLAHELRNPLAPIRNAVEIQKFAGSNPSRLSWCNEVIERQVEHLTRLVDDLLDVSRISRGLVELRKEALEVQDFISLAVETSQPLIDSRQHTISVEFPPYPVWVEGDRIRLAQVVSNLINNAAKYTEAGGRIGLSLKVSHQEACIHVSDNGSGIDPADLPYLFNLFYQANRNLDRAQGGLGIGLSLVHNLVMNHGGHIQAFSAGRGQGSEFVIKLPRLTFSPSITATPTFLCPNKLRILVVDDNRDALESLALLLESEGHRVSTAFDGISALEAAQTERPDIILLDIGLPEVDGYAVAQALRQNHHLERIRLIAVTGYGQLVDRKKSSASGFDEHLVKPIDIGKLRKLLASYPATAFYESPKLID